jgi:pantoate--beta-alanine ligase
MELIRDIQALQQFLSAKREQNLTCGFVPTMGALHQGHISLIKKAQKETDFCLVSIFVNPTQFNESKDFNNYPRQEEKDISMLQAAKVDAVFLPRTEEMYSAGNPLLHLDLEGLDQVMEGTFRPGHFQGVVTVVDKFFSLVHPQKAFFGLKDFQQLAVIRLLARKRYPEIEIVPCEILREPHGLAMSSRNELLNSTDREHARWIFKILSEVAQNWKTKPFGELLDNARKAFNSTMMELEYLEISDALSLKPISDYCGVHAVACVAVRIGGIRLIDNIELPA